MGWLGVCVASVGQKSDMRILNKIVRETPNGIELEADPRHAEIAIKELGLQDAKASPVPGSKEEAKKVVEEEVPKKEMASTKVRRDLQRELGAIAEACKSADGKIWDAEVC